MDTLEVVDNYTVKFTIKETFAPFLTKVAIPTNHWAVRHFGDPVPAFVYRGYTQPDCAL